MCVSHVADGKGIVYDDKAVDNLLDRNQVGEETTEGGENLLANEYLGSFKVSCGGLKRELCCCSELHLYNVKVKSLSEKWLPFLNRM